MRAVVCHEFGPYRDMTVEDIDPPAIADDRVLIDTRATGVSFGTSLVIAGKYQRKPPRPFAPGTEVAGVVSEVGAAVEGIKPGDRVYAAIDWGGFAETAAARDIHTHVMPDAMDFAEATLFPISYPTSYAALIWKGRLEAGETVLVNGAAGAVGLAAVEIAKAKGATVVATAGSEAKRQLARDHGADEAIGYDALRDAVKDFTDGRGADVVFDPIGGDVFMQSLRATAREGRLVTIGYASGTIPEPPVNFLLVKNMSIVGLNYGTYLGWSPGDDGSAYAEAIEAMQADLHGMFEAGRLKPVVSHRFPLGDFADAMDTVLARKSTGKVVLEV
ncbi:MAG: NADPH:quinone oxidoreductase family protein [Magnetovibrio sp.]|nr:NADPH:quinone oxidoreductase family protein [Magnetovibrio sp.]